jgi:hypothetical protein
MQHTTKDEGLEFGHEFHGHEHHFRVTREALAYLTGDDVSDERAMTDAYNAHRERIHALAAKLSRTADGQARIVLEKEAFES